MSHHTLEEDEKIFSVGTPARETWERMAALLKVWGFQAGYRLPKHQLRTLYALNRLSHRPYRGQKLTSEAIARAKPYWWKKKFAVAHDDAENFLRTYGRIGTIIPYLQYAWDERNRVYTAVEHYKEATDGPALEREIPDEVWHALIREQAPLETVALVEKQLRLEAAFYGELRRMPKRFMADPSLDWYCGGWDVGAVRDLVNAHGPLYIDFTKTPAQSGPLSTKLVVAGGELLATLRTSGLALSGPSGMITDLEREFPADWYPEDVRIAVAKTLGQEQARSQDIARWRTTVECMRMSPAARRTHRTAPICATVDMADDDTNYPNWMVRGLERLVEVFTSEVPWSTRKGNVDVDSDWRRYLAKHPELGADKDADPETNAALKVAVEVWTDTDLPPKTIRMWRDAGLNTGQDWVGHFRHVYYRWATGRIGAAYRAWLERTRVEMREYAEAPILGGEANRALRRQDAQRRYRELVAGALEATFKVVSEDEWPGNPEPVGAVFLTSTPERSGTSRPIALDLAALQRWIRGIVWDEETAVWMVLIGEPAVRIPPKYLIDAKTGLRLDQLTLTRHAIERGGGKEALEVASREGLVGLGGLDGRRERTAYRDLPFEYVTVGRVSGGDEHVNLVVHYSKGPWGVTSEGKHYLKSSTKHVSLAVTFLPLGVAATRVYAGPAAEEIPLTDVWVWAVKTVRALAALDLDWGRIWALEKGSITAVDERASDVVLNTLRTVPVPPTNMERVAKPA